MESCFAHVDQCHQEKYHKEECLLESKQCFAHSHYGFDYCFRLLTDCVGETGEGHHHEEEEEEKYCDCSCQMEKCFSHKDKSACSHMFDVCFHSDEEEQSEDHDYHHSEPGPDTCIERVRECLHSSDDQDLCLQLLSSCITAEITSPGHLCSSQLVKCVTDNKYNTNHCLHLISACTDSADSARATTDCYSHIELCYKTTNSESHDVCTALLPTCYQHTEETYPTSCYTKARACLLNNYISNTDCHHQLKTCLAEEEVYEHEHEHEQTYYEENPCKENVKLCLSSSQYSASSCYEELQHYLAGGDCHQN